MNRCVFGDHFNLIRVDGRSIWKKISVFKQKRIRLDGAVKKNKHYRTKRTMPIVMVTLDRR